MINHVIERLAAKSHGQACHMGEIGRTQPAGMKTKVDRAMDIARILEGRYADCDRVILVCDNLNTHTNDAFYQAFALERT